VEDAGAALLDLTQVTPEIYEDVVKSLRIPVIGGQAPPQADGKIYVSYNLVGYQAQTMDATDGRPSAASFIYEIAKKALDNVHAGKW
jgi:ketopantoate hydroxymethyltransferase